MNRQEERELLEEWFATVHFDEEYEGVPELEPEEDDEDGDERSALWEERAGDNPGHPFHGNQWNGTAGASVPVSSMTRKQLTAHLAATGYTGPTSYTMSRLRNIADRHLGIAPANPANPGIAPPTPPRPHVPSSVPPTPHPSPTAAVPQKPIGKMTRPQLTAHLKANGYTGPTSYNMGRLRDIANTHMESRASTTAPVTGGTSRQHVKGVNHETDAMWVSSALSSATPLPDPNYHHADKTLAKLTHAQGFDGKPQVVGQSTFNQMSKDGSMLNFTHKVPGYQVPAGGSPVLHRGVNGNSHKTGQAMADDLRGGTFFAGGGIYGNGTYSTLDRYTANQYGTTRMKFGLRADAKMGHYDEVSQDHKRWLRSTAGQQAQRHGVYDLSHYAVIKGYDGLIVDGPMNPGHVVIYNRSAMIIQQENG